MQQQRRVHAAAQVCVPVAPILAEGGNFPGGDAPFAEKIMFLKAARRGSLRTNNLSFHRRAYCE